MSEAKIGGQLDAWSADENQFPIGYRYVTTVGEQGENVIEQVPLSDEDFLHPHEDDELVSNINHDRDVAYLRASACQTVRSNRRRLVLSDVNIDWEIWGGKAIRPDVVVFVDPGELSTTLQGTFYPNRVGAKAKLVIEVTSPYTRHIDLSRKVEKYEQAEVPFYALVDYDPAADPCHATVFGYRLTPTGYQRVEPDHRGWLWLDSLWLWLAWENGMAICYEADCRPVLEVGELRDRFDQTEARCNELEQATEEAIIARAAALAQIRRQNEQLQQAEAARQQAEDRIAELMAQLARLQGPQS